MKMQPELLEEWAVQFGNGSVEEAESEPDANRKMREIREAIAAIGSPAVN
jgi:hypothetical protein